MKSVRKTKFIVVTGGVISGIGKGVATASLASLIGENFRIIPIKCDGYLNSDPGTINPIEHGEVFVLDDGGEVDMDFGHYERFLDIQAKQDWNITMGKVYKEIIDQEREGKFLGKTVQLIPHVTDNIKNRIYSIADEENADFIVIEVGGTVGDLENALFIEAIRQMRLQNKSNMLFVHLTYIPKPLGVNEQKSKPTQQSVKIINEMGLYPDIIIARSHEPLSPSIVDKIALYCNIDRQSILVSPEVDSLYYLPKVFYDQNVNQLIDEHFQIQTKPNINFFNNIYKSHSILAEQEAKYTVGICGKYVDLEDSYASITESLDILMLKYTQKINIVFIDTTKERVALLEDLKKLDGIIIPGGFGSRGIEGKIIAVEYARTNNIPFLGICYGMQLAVIEFARNVCGIKDANTREVEKEIKGSMTPVVELLEGQRHINKKGGTMRLGGHDVTLKPKTLASAIFNNASTTRERFRHRYEINPIYVPQLEEKGMVFSGYSASENIMQIVELPNHPFFMACQFHPELHSSLKRPSPLFDGLVKKIIKK